MIELHGHTYELESVERIRFLRQFGNHSFAAGIEVALDLIGPGGLRLAVASVDDLESLGVPLVQVGPGAFTPLQNVADLDESAGVVMTRDGALYSISGADIATVLEHLENT